MGGALVGVRRQRHAGAHLVRASRSPCSNLKLDKSVEPLPVDSTFTIRLKGSIGQKYLADHAGARRAATSRTARPCRSARPAPTVDLDQVLSMFTPADPHRRRRLDDRLQRRARRPRRRPQRRDRRVRPAAHGPLPVARNLASPTHRSRRLLPRARVALRRRSRRSRRPQARLFVNLDTTFRALASVADPVPPALDLATRRRRSDAVIADSPTIRPFLTDTRGAVQRAPPGYRDAAARARPVLADAFAAGTTQPARDRGARPAHW